jgi:Flp pilus assembly protein TadG
MRGVLHRLRRDQKGATIVEFAIVAPVLMMMLMGFMDLAHTAYARSVLQGAMQMAARNSTLETGLTSQSTIDSYVEDQLEFVVGRNASFSSTRKSYSDFSKVGTAERYTDTAPVNNRYDLGECFEDVNGNGRWDADLGKDGQGGAQDAVLYTMTVNYNRLFPMASLLGWSSQQSISASTVLRNQPYGNQIVPTVPPCS